MKTLTETKPAAITTVATKDMRAALNLAKQVIQRRNTIPVLGMARVTVKRGRCTISASDLDRYMQATCDADGPAIDFLIAPNLLNHLLMHGGPTICMSIEKGERSPVIAIKTGDLSARFNLHIKVEDMPIDVAQDGDFDKAQAIDASELRRALDAVAVSMSDEETRYYLNGAYFHQNKDTGCLRLVSTDGHRLTRFDLPGVPWERDGVIVHKEVIAQLRRDLRGVDTVNVSFAKDRLRLRFETAGWKLTSKLIDGKFPDYTRVIPEVDGTFDVSVSGDALAALPFLRDFGSAALHLHPDENRMWVKSVELGEVSLPLTGKGGLCGINLRYMRDFCPRGEAVRVIGNTQKNSQVSRSVSAALIIQGADENMLRVVMPMRV